MSYNTAFESIETVTKIFGYFLDHEISVISES